MLARNVAAAQRGPHMIAQGNALGKDWRSKPRALKGRNNLLCTLTEPLLRAPLAFANNCFRAKKPCWCPTKLLRPFRASLSVRSVPQGVALGCYIPALRASANMLRSKKSLRASIQKHPLRSKWAHFLQTCRASSTLLVRAGLN